jgi:peptidylprolyl isomerase
MKKIILITFVLILTVLVSCSNDPEIVTLESGLMYLDDSLGTGREAKAEDLVSLHFSGWMIRDTSDLFSDWSADQQRMAYTLGNTQERNQPVKFVLGSNAFIKGTDDGITGMKPGGVRTIIIPSELAYGEKGMGPIPPNTDLKLVIELLEVKDRIVVEMWDVDSSTFNTTKSGLRYAILKEGEGVEADSGKVVTVHYSGYLESGTKFDSSVERDEPFSFVLGMRQVIPGWDEGLSFMKKGTKARFIIPPDLGYGSMELAQIPANSTLIFDVELLDLQ